MDLSTKDKKILNIITDDSRQSYRQIAKKAKISVVTVMKHVAKLEHLGIIKKYTAIIDYEQLGYDVSVIIDVRVAKGKLIQVEKKIAEHQNVVSVYDKTGQFDITVIARFKNTRSMDDFLKFIQSLDFVERTETKLILKTMKDTVLKV